MYTLSNENFAAPLAYSECALRQCVLNEPPTSLQRASNEPSTRAVFTNSSSPQIFVSTRFAVYTASASD